VERSSSKRQAQEEEAEPPGDVERDEGQGEKKSFEVAGELGHLKIA